MATQVETSTKLCDVIDDKFSSLEEVSGAIKNAGLETCSLMFGIDYTSSNKNQGQKTFEGKSLHDLSDTDSNPYQQVINILGKTLEPFDEDGLIPTFGFGDSKTENRSVFKLKLEGECKGFAEVLNVYNEITQAVEMSGPASYAPLIKKAVEIVKETNEYHILVIVADGQVSNIPETKEALIEASQHALSIILVGVGDGPWESMHDFDDGLEERQFDNFQFVNFHEVMKDTNNSQAQFALNCLMEIPEQYAYINKEGLLKST